MNDHLLKLSVSIQRYGHLTKLLSISCKKSDEFESQVKTGTLNDQLLEDQSLITGLGGILMNHLPVNLKTYLRNYRLDARSPPLYKGKKASIRY